jgi:hypothetical protein
MRSLGDIYNFTSRSVLLSLFILVCASRTLVLVRVGAR